MTVHKISYIVSIISLGSTARPVDQINKLLLFTVTDGGLFGFYDLENKNDSARLFKIGLIELIFTKTLTL